MRIVASAAALIIAGVIPAAAASLDFSGVQGSNPSPLALPNATLTNLTGSTILVGLGAAGQSDGFCFIAPNSSCEADGQIDFLSPIQNLTFDVDGWNPGDTVSISAFFGANFLGSIVATANGMLDFSGFGTLDRLFFDDNSTGAGVGYSTFSFEPASAVVPLPAAAPLLLGGLAALGLFGRRRRT